MTIKTLCILIKPAILIGISSTKWHKGWFTCNCSSYKDTVLNLLTAYLNCWLYSGSLARIFLSSSANRQQIRKFKKIFLIQMYYTRIYYDHLKRKACKHLFVWRYWRQYFNHIRDGTDMVLKMENYCRVLMCYWTDEIFLVTFLCCHCFLEFSVGVRAFVIRLSDSVRSLPFSLMYR